MRWLAWGFAGLLTLVLLAAAGTWFLLPRFDLASLASRRATAALGRPVTFATLHLTPGRWITVTATDAHLANAEGGSRPDMATLRSATAELQAWPLLHGTLSFRTVTVDGLDLLLERVNGAPNWHFHPKPPATDQTPHRDGDFPDLAALTVSGTIHVRTGSGTDLPVGLDHVTFTAPVPDAPTTLSGPASYKGIALQLQADLGSLAQYRNAAQPFPATIDLLTADKTHLRFEGTLVDPLNLDGAAGHLLVEALTPATLARLAGAETTIDPAIRLQGPFEHAANDWKLSQIQGKLGPATIETGELHLIEGTRETETAPLTPDRLGIAVQFARLDVDTLMGRQKKSGGDNLSLEVDPNPSMLVAASLRAKDLTWSGIRFADVALDAAQAPGAITLKALSVTYLGGKLAAQGRLEAAEPGTSRIAAELRATGIETAPLRALLDMNRLPITGRLDAHATLTATGSSVEAALPAARASAVLTMAGGTVSRQIVQLGSTDIRALFGTPSGNTPIACALAVLDMRGGLATITPLRLRSAEGTIAVHGTVDVLRHTLDLTVASEPGTTAATALDIPVHVSGPFTNPSIAPASRIAARAPDQVSRLPPALQPAARASPCLAR